MQMGVPSVRPSVRPSIRPSFDCLSHLYAKATIRDILWCRPKLTCVTQSQAQSPALVTSDVGHGKKEEYSSMVFRFRARTDKYAL